MAQLPLSARSAFAREAGCPVCQERPVSQFVTDRFIVPAGDVLALRAGVINRR